MGCFVNINIRVVGLGERRVGGLLIGKLGVFVGIWLWREFRILIR